MNVFTIVVIGSGRIFGTKKMTSKPFASYSDALKSVDKFLLNCSDGRGFDDLDLNIPYKVQIMELEVMTHENYLKDS